LAKFIALVVIASSVAACSSVTIRPEGGDKNRAEPSYLDSKPFYFWGLLGEHEIDVNTVCEGATVEQMQTVATVSDFLLGAVTLYIYAPRTAKIWCGE
jgi:hypothetical protein